MLNEIHYVSAFQFSRTVTDSALHLSSGPAVVTFATRLLLLASICSNTSLLPAHHSTYLLPVRQVKQSRYRPGVAQRVPGS